MPSRSSSDSIRKPLCRLVATALVPLQVLVALPVAAAPRPAPAATAPAGAGAAQATRPAPASPAAANRTRPAVEAAPLVPQFSAEPTTAEITRARVFGEPIVPIGGEPTPEENTALARALRTYHAGGDPERLEPFAAFLAAHPKSPWRASLQMNLGVTYERHGYFGRAETALEDAWHLAKDVELPPGRDVADRAVGELLDIHEQFGDMDGLSQVLAEVGDREVRGAANALVGRARGASWILENRHEDATPSARVALREIARAKLGRVDSPALDAIHATHDGATLETVQAAAEEMGLGLVLAEREGNAEIPVPALVHLKRGHYAAVVRHEGTRYVIEDPMLGGTLWMSEAALQEETSGYFLVPEAGRGEGQPGRGKKALPPGWRPGTQDKARQLRGRCVSIFPDPDKTGHTCEHCPRGLPSYRFNLLLVSLQLADTPLGYSPPRGPDLRLNLTYDQREATQPATFTYSNVGPQWSLGWQAFIEDDPSNPEADAQLYVAGGGRETFTGYSAGSYAALRKDRSVLVRVSSSPIVYERRLSDGSVETYSQSDGAISPRRVFLTEERDPQGNTRTYAYDGQLRLASVTDAIGQVTTLHYELATDPLKLTRVTDPFSREATLEYDDLGRLVAITDVIGLRAEFGYSASHFVRTLETPYGTTRFDTGSFSPAHDGAYIQATDPLGGTERAEYRYTNPGIQGGEPVPAGFEPLDDVGLYGFSAYYWDKRAWALAPGDYSKATITRWLLESELRLGPYPHSIKRPLENRVWYLHEGGNSWLYAGPMGRPARIGRVLDDGSSQITRYEYNDLGQITRETDPVGRETVYEYAANGIDLLTVKQKVDGSFETTSTRTYNSQHQPLTITDAAGGTTTFTYNTAGQVLTVTTPPAQGYGQGATTTFSYDTDGYLETISGPVSGATTSITYDSYGRRRTLTDPTNLTLTYDYDSLDRLTKVTWPDSTYQETVYNRLDAERQRDRLGRWTHTFYDALRRAATVRDPLGRTVTYNWCDCGSLDSLVDANGNETRWERDLQGRVTREVRANDSDTAFTYETTTSRLKQRRDPRNITTTYEYFKDDRLKRKSYSDATPAVDYTYDDQGRLKTAADSVDSLTWSYDLDGQLLSEASSRNSTIVAYAYDLAGNRTQLDLNSSTFVTYGYDQTSRLTSITRGSNVFGFGYDTASRRTSMSYPNDIDTAYSYDSESRLTEISATLGMTVITDTGYSYDAVGNRTQKTTPDYSEDYGYDFVSQLTSVKRTGLTPNRWFFAYDKAGNRTSEQIDTTATQSSYDNMNRLQEREAGGTLLFKGTVDEPAAVTVQGKPADVKSDNSFTGPAQVPSGTSEVTVTAQDPSGNLRTNVYEVSGVTGGAATYSYDPNGNLASKTEGTDVWGYEWNAERQLTRVTKDSTEVATFKYDPLGRRVEKVAGGVTTAYAYEHEDILRETRTGGTVFKYVHGPGIDEPLAREDQTAALNYYHVDGLGSILKRTNQAGAVAHEYRYDSWGNIEAGGTESGYAFTGREWDPETGHYYYRARSYEPTAGRFISEDPIGFEGGINFYSYVLNNPTKYVDPWGLDVKVCFYPEQLLIFGHLGFGFPGEPTYGFYNTKREPRGPGQIKQDDPAERNICKTLQATPQQDQCMLDCRERRRRNPGQYDYKKRNCTLFVEDCLIICGLPYGHRTPEPIHLFNLLPHSK